MSEEVDLKRENSDQELYKPPPEKSLSEILDSDKNDESLQLYKEKLLGIAAKDVVVSVFGCLVILVSHLLNLAIYLLLVNRKIIRLSLTFKQIIDHNNPNRVIVKELALLVDGRDDMVIDLQNSSLEEIKNTTFTIKEGIKYRIRIRFWVQREIVTGKAGQRYQSNRLLD